MKTAKFLILISSFLVFTGKAKASGWFSNMLTSYLDYEDGSESDNEVSSSQDDSDYEDFGVHPGYTMVDYLAKSLYNNMFQQDKPGARYVSKAGKSGDEFIMSTQDVVEAEEISENDAKTIKQAVVENIEIPVITVESAVDPKEEEETAVPTANPVEIAAAHFANDPDTPAESIEVATNELMGKTFVKQDYRDVNSFIEKARTTTCKNLGPVPANNSSYYRRLIKLLKDSYMGDFDFSSVEPESVPAPKNKNFTNRLFNDYQDEAWMNMNWEDLTESEFHNSIKNKLKKVAPITMQYLPSLAPKTTYERDVLENWLISGLLAAYPTLTNGITKDDAIALILLAVISKSFTKPENEQIIVELIKELEKYNGNLPNKFPLDQFTFDHDDSREEAQANLMRTLLKIVQERNLPFTRKVMDDIARFNE